MAVVALIPAAGLGARFHDGGPKALVRLAGKPFLVHALERLAASGRVDRAVVAVSPGHEAAFAEALGGFGAMPVATTAGGQTRRDSVVAAWRASGATDDDLLCVHDAARPLVEPADVAAVVAAAAAHGAAVAGSPVTDTIKRVRDGVVLETVPRHDLFAAATPQVFRAGLLREAVEAGLDDATDDVELLERRGVTVRTVATSRWNVKITWPEDLARAEAWLAAGGRT
ncbi:MAG: 2-C-methyl-D-erythritol 4-phosphate cytidylyltransferase [Thermoanaerobaculia bacterium]|nr:2-C-methyl-D-erythritol 4-phosphate cytidylyltransferase [Thermoanaerobaculia bacterium]